jgi:hypothetical protein
MAIFELGPFLVNTLSQEADFSVAEKAPSK